MKTIGLLLAVICLSKIVSPADVGKPCTADNACTDFVTCCVRPPGNGQGKCTKYGDRGEPCEPGGGKTIHGKCPCKPGDFCLNGTCKNVTLDGDVGRQCMADDRCTEGKTCCATPSGMGKGACKMYGDPGDPCEVKGSSSLHVNCPCKKGSVCKNGECVDKLDSGKKCMADSGCTRRKTCCATPTGMGQGKCKLYARPGDPCMPGAMKTIHVECPCIQGFICVQGSCVMNATAPAPTK